MTIHYINTSLNTAESINRVVQRLMAAKEYLIDEYYTQKYIDSYRDYFLACETGNMVLLLQFTQQKGKSFEPYIENEKKLNWLKLSSQHHQYALFEYLLFTYQLRITPKERRFLKRLPDAQMFEAIIQKYQRAKKLNKALLKEIKKGNLATVKMMIQNDNECERLIDINLVDLRNYQATPVMIACECKNSTKAMAMVQYLLTSKELREKSNLHARNFHGVNVLSYAVIHKHLNIVKYLLTSCELDEPCEVLNTENNSSVIMLASMYGYLDIIQYLLETPDTQHLFHLEDRDERCNTALDYAFHHHQKDVICYFLMEHNMFVEPEYLEYCQSTPKLHDIAQLIQARDLHAKIQKNLSQKNHSTIRGKI